jgi:DNA end-binding protein Ku
MKAMWKGSLNFGLVTIDLELFTAIKEHAISFKLLHEKCHTPIRNLHWCEKDNEEVPWSDIVKGLPVGKNKFFVMTKEAIEKLKPLKSDTIAIEAFFSQDVLDPIWYDQHYYVLPQKDSDPAFGLFVAALERSKKAAFGKVIFREKEHLCLLQPYHKRLLLSTLHYAYQVRPLVVPKKEMKFDSEELELAEYLIEKLSRKNFEPEKYKDTFVERLKKVIKAGPKKIASTKEKSIKKQESKKTLREILQKSLSTISKK